MDRPRVTNLRDPASAPDREASARQIVAAARATRRPWPRWLWIVALAVGAVCAGALAIGWFTAGSEASSVPATTPASTTGLGTGTWLVIGVSLGIGIGIAIGRRAR